MDVPHSTIEVTNNPVKRITVKLNYFISSV
jgi:hypothetical protein